MRRARRDIYGWLPMLLCLLLSAGAALGGLGMWSVAKSAIHEIAALVAFLVAAVYLVGACVTFQLGKIRERLEARPEPAAVEGWDRAEHSNLMRGRRCGSCGGTLAPSASRCLQCGWAA